jgi:hypothetical protein
MASEHDDPSIIDVKTYWLMNPRELGHQHSGWGFMICHYWLQSMIPPSSVNLNEEPQEAQACDISARLAIKLAMAQLLSSTCSDRSSPLCCICVMGTALMLNGLRFEKRVVVEFRMLSDLLIHGCLTRSGGAANV